MRTRVELLGDVRELPITAWDRAPHAIDEASDAADYWYRARIAERPRTRAWLHLDGLATLAEVFVNDVLVLRSSSAFLHHVVDITEHLRGGDTLAIHILPLAPILAEKRPRPRWRTRLVKEQTLRYVRTPLVGRMPGWATPRPLVGVLGGVWIEDAAVDASRIDVKSSLVGEEGLVEFSCDGAHSVVRVPNVERWWPHTQGAQKTYDVTTTLKVAGQDVALLARRVGFRAIDVNLEDGAFVLRCNGVPVFCRGAVWAPLSYGRGSARGAQDDRVALRLALEQMKRAGFNMVRLSGVGFYESRDFYDLCDELGLLVWQDFMFANMAYPVDDAAWITSARQEVRQICHALSARPSVAVLCGSSEVEQQAAMLGLAASDWRSPLFDVEIPKIVGETIGAVPYVSSTPTGGVLPFHVSEGVGHYYGVGAYRRPLEDARRANIRFASECLAFSHVPQAAALARHFAPAEEVPHHPAWKAGVPRDVGVGWDFEDVRDHYTTTIFGADVPTLRAADPARYLALSRVVTGEVIARTFAEFRRSGSSTKGALLWMLRDLVPGAGWGIIDSDGGEKPAYWPIARACQPITVLLTDEGVNGVDAHVINETARARALSLTVTLYRDGVLPIETATRAVDVAARATLRIPTDGVIERFTDAAYAYRFGPPGHNVVVARLADEAGVVLARAFHFPTEYPLAPRPLEIDARAEGDRIHFTAKELALFVALSANADVAFDDNHFHLEPGQTHTVSLLSARTRPCEVVATPLNGASSLRVKLP